MARAGAVGRGQTLSRRPSPAATLFELERRERHLRRPPSAIEADTAVRLRRIVAHARVNVPIYRGLYANGVEDSIHRVGDVGGLPIVDKDAFRARPVDDRRSGTPPPGTFPLYTGGSTGEPFLVDYTPHGQWWFELLGLRLSREHGIRWRDTRAHLAFHADPRPRSRWSWLFGHSLRIPFTLGPDAVAERLLELRPASVSGHGHVLVEVGERLRGRLQPTLVRTGGTVLSPEDRATIERLYGVAPADVYGTTEHGVIAAQCPARDLYHVHPESVLVEVLDEGDRPAPRGASGAFVITNLWNTQMPFIRYRIGDQGALADRPCKCGWALPAIVGIDGRSLDWLVDDQGRRVAPQRLSLHHHAGDLPTTAVSRYRIHQESDGRTSVELVAREPIPRDALELLRRSYVGLLGEGTVVEVRQVDAIALGPVGKHRLFTSDRRPTSVG